LLRLADDVCGFAHVSRRAGVVVVLVANDDGSLMLELNASLNAVLTIHVDLGVADVPSRW
jgi:hypothetical protein